MRKLYSRLRSLLGRRVLWAPKSFTKVKTKADIYEVDKWLRTHTLGKYSITAHRDVSVEWFSCTWYHTIGFENPIEAVAFAELYSIK